MLCVQLQTWTRLDFCHCWLRRCDSLNTFFLPMGTSPTRSWSPGHTIRCQSLKVETQACLLLWSPPESSAAGLHTAPACCGLLPGGRRLCLFSHSGSEIQDQPVCPQVHGTSYSFQRQKRCTESHKPEAVTDKACSLWLFPAGLVEITGSV